jgi:CHASE1-domain containing sensor protein
MSLLVEMKRRKVLRATFVYGVVSWLVLQINDVVGPILDLPAWVAKLVFFLLLGGLPVMLVLAWQFDLTSLGIYREKPWQQNGGDAASGEDKRVLSRAVKCIACLWVVFLGIGLSVGAAAVIHLHEARMIEHQFDLMAQEIAHEIGHRLKSDKEALHTLGVLFMGNRKPGLDTFRQLSEKILAEHDEIKAIEWVPLVTAEERAAFVAKMKKIYPGFAIKAFDTNGAEIVPEQREIYFPVAYTVPKVGNEEAIGFDLLSNPDRAAALNDAIVSGTVLQTKAIKLVQSGATGFLMFNPMFRDDEVPVSRAARVESLRGFTLGVIDARTLVASAVAACPGAAEFVGEIVVHEGEAVSNNPILRIDTSNGSDLSASTRALAIADGGLGLSALIELRPTRALIVKQFSFEHYVVGGVGVLLSIVCAMAMNAISASRPMPKKTSDLGESANEGVEENKSDPVAGRGNRPGVVDLIEERDWRTSSWRTS